jgi:hypothetical protein
MKQTKIIMKNKALLVGINQYPNPNNSLRGCVNDILDMEHYIAETNKVYAKENIKKLTDKDATKQGIINQIKWLLEGATPGDQLLFHYSGHGAQAATLFPHLESDGLDEIICPYDFNGSSATAFRDKEFAYLFAAIPKGVHFIWISDSCHAEDLSRDPVSSDPVSSHALQYRYFNTPHPVLAEPAATLLANKAPVLTPLNGAMLSACSSNQLSADAIINNRFNGAFTHYLIENLMEYPHKPLELIVDLVDVDLTQNGYDQNPHIEGLLQDRKFFL